MCKEEWLSKLEKDQSNREGLGMYVLDCFNESIAEELALHDSLLLDELKEKVKATCDEEYKVYATVICNILDNLKERNEVD